MKLQIPFKNNQHSKDVTSLEGYTFVRPFFLEGFARMFDFSGSLDNYDYLHGGAEADARAIYQDWVAVGNDLRTTFAQFEEEK